MMTEISVVTTQKEEYVDITLLVQKHVTKSAVKNGIAHIFIPHTTAAVTINENADPDVMNDIRGVLKEIVPRYPFRHGEGNSPAHLKSSLVGASLLVAVENTALCLGTWQGIYFCEFDGPRQRKVWVTMLSEKG